MNEARNQDVAEDPRCMIVYSRGAVDTFTRVTGCSHIVRAHDPPFLGFLPSKDARVITVFSSSQYGSMKNPAAVVVALDNRLRFVTTSAFPHDDEDHESEDAADAPADVSAGDATLEESAQVVGGTVELTQDTK